MVQRELDALFASICDLVVQKQAEQYATQSSVESQHNGHR